MLFKPRQRVVDNLELLGAYIDAHDGTVTGQISTTLVDASGNEVGQGSSYGRFFKLPVHPTTGEISIYFESDPEADLPYAGIVDESSFAVDAAYVYSRKRIKL